MNEGV